MYLKFSPVIKCVLFVLTVKVIVVLGNNYNSRGTPPWENMIVSLKNSNNNCCLHLFAYFNSSSFDIIFYKL